MAVRIMVGDVRRRLRDLPTGSVDCCMTSPPYHGLRSYLPDDHPDKALEIGLELDLNDWVGAMVEVFGEVYRVLRPEGTLWLNLGDSYAGTRDPKAKNTDYITGKSVNKSALAAGYTASRRRDDRPIPRSDVKTPGFKNKDMHGQPWRTAFALQGFAVISCKTIAEWADMLQAARAGRDWAMVETVERRLRAWDYLERMKSQGWILRQEIIWAKPNPMPESTKDRCTKAHEHVFLFAKQRYYFFNHRAIQEPCSPNTHARVSQDVLNQAGSQRAHGGGQREGRPMKAVASKEAAGLKRPGFGHGYDTTAKPRYLTPSGWATGTPGRRHDEKVGRYGSANTKAELAGRAEGGATGDGISARMGRGPGWRELDRGSRQNLNFQKAISGTVVEFRNKRTVWEIPTQAFKGAHFATFPEKLVEPCVLAGCPPGGTVLDIFGGSGTTALVAQRHHMDSILIDLDGRNVPMVRQRINAEASLLSDITVDFETTSPNSETT